MEHKPKVLIVATSSKTRGGITSVIKAHQKGTQWNTYQCKWLETHIDKNLFYKLLFFIRSFVEFIFLAPFYDIIHIHTSEPPSLIRKSLYFFIARCYHKKIIIHFHAYSPQTTIFGKYQWLYKYIFSHAEKIVVLSDYWKRTIQDAFGNNPNIITIYNPCDICISPLIYEKKNYILYAGTINQRKGYKDLILAFAAIAKQYPDWKVVFAGNGEIAQAKEIAIAHNIEQQVVFLGWVENKIKDKAFKEAKIFCLPSYAEGFPMAVLDAWAYGLPVISTPVGGLPDIAIDNSNILLFAPGDIKGLSAKITQLITDTTLRSQLSNAGLALATTTFSIKNINHQIEELYNSLLKKKHNDDTRIYK